MQIKRAARRFQAQISAAELLERAAEFAAQPASRRTALMRKRTHPRQRKWPRAVLWNQNFSKEKPTWP
jgi:hypothetical protein